MSFFAAIVCQHGHRHESARCEEVGCLLCCTDIRECDVAKFVRRQVADDERVAINRRATGVS